MSVTVRGADAKPPCERWRISKCVQHLCGARHRVACLNAVGRG